MFARDRAGRSPVPTFVFEANNRTGVISFKKTEPLSGSAFTKLRKKEEKNWITL
jgi:hypothetical protein